MPGSISSMNTGSLIRQEFWGPKALLKGAILTRVAIGVARCVVELPQNNPNMELTPQQKQKAFLERLFIEGGGVSVHVGMIYAFQELFANIFRGMKTLNPLHEKNFQHLTAHVTDAKELAEAKKALTENFFDSDNRLVRVIAKRLYRQGDLYKKYALVMQALDKLQNPSPELRRGIQSFLQHYSARISIISATTLVISIISSAILSGYVWQWINDNLISNRAIPWLQSKLGTVSPSKSAPANLSLKNVATHYGPSATAMRSAPPLSQWSLPPQPVNDHLQQPLPYPPRQAAMRFAQTERQQ